METILTNQTQEFCKDTLMLPLGYVPKYNFNLSSAAPLHKHISAKRGSRPTDVDFQLRYIAYLM